MTLIRSRSLLIALLACAVCLASAPLVRAADKEKESEETELAKHMETIDKSMKKLKKSLKNASENATSAELVKSMREASAACVPLIPVMAKKVPEADRAKFVENYKKDIEAFLAEVDKLAAAVKDGKNEEAVSIHKALGELEDKGHEKYIEEEK